MCLLETKHAPKMFCFYICSKMKLTNATCAPI